MKKLIAILATFVMLFAFAACGSSDDAQGDDSSNTQATQETMKSDGVVKVDVPNEEFYGTWTGESDKAEYLYGSLEIVINDDGTWTGDITGEKLHGTWTEEDFGIHLHDEVLEWESDLFYTEKGNFVLSEDGMKIVLTKH
ncbi:MAG: hypothetical protein Q4D99_05940 [Bacillota bacterium]|nr:hypothetical protein [Bacillota bacterium]